MTKAASVVISTMIASFISVSAQADIYRCSVNGEIQYTDRPCADGERVIKSHTDNSNRELHDESSDIPQAENRTNAPEDRRAKAEARRQEVESAAVKREADDLWKRRNMSVSCFTQKYNAWASGRSPRPTPDEVDRKIEELLRECRDIYRIPQDTPAAATSSARK